MPFIISNSPLEPGVRIPALDLPTRVSPKLSFNHFGRLSLPLSWPIPSSSISDPSDFPRPRSRFSIPGHDLWLTCPEPPIRGLELPTIRTTATTNTVPTNHGILDTLLPTPLLPSFSLSPSSPPSPLLLSPPSLYPPLLHPPLSSFPLLPPSIPFLSTLPSPFPSLLLLFPGVSMVSLSFYQSRVGLYTQVP